MDFSDAYMHLRVADAELQHCLVYHSNPDLLDLFHTLCFGLRAAPLLWGRFAAALSHMVQALVPEDVLCVQEYIDDPLCCLRGPHLQ
eukprot:6151563-Amphidinium_carterae.1